EDDMTKNVDVSDAHSFHSIHEEDNNEDANDHCFIPDWGLMSNLCISSYHDCKEMISHLTTPPKDEVLHRLTNYEVVRLTYQSLGRSILSQAKLLRRHEELNHDHIDLRNRSDVQLEELNCLRSDWSYFDRLKDMEKDRDEWRQTAAA
ncbi:hypothetical protein Tco_1139231, partial [Tanacetum coccineum]